MKNQNADDTGCLGENTEYCGWEVQAATDSVRLRAQLAIEENRTGFLKSDTTPIRG
ncbi:hypothetical protein [Paraburkholderia sp.]|uniref:hypothetical protein n=1 Tax=Paraburkholderia sp. TaxID=1926495 RepID=UPI002D3EB5D4|nr:hypothetical protein [Paraburkholderia sp.]HZZ06628.1 hypothetical protein [Paraburkholderia sp.]